MFPIGDDDQGSGRGPAIVTIALIVLNVLVFMLELGQGSEASLQSFITAWGVVPREYSVGRDLPPLIPFPFWATLITSMFLHGGWMHLGGNMLYLWIFGDNIEDRIGHAKFLIFYLVCGLAASVAHIMFATDSVIPSLGASGAIAGVLGAYLVLFPKRSVKVLAARQVVNMPAFMVLGMWILLQVFAQISVVGGAGGGDAYMAHIGGFLAGLALIFLFGKRTPTMDHVPR